MVAAFVRKWAVGPLFFLKRLRERTDMTLDASLREQLNTLAQSEGLELLATEAVGNGPKMILRLVVDGPDGVSLDQCASISKQASPILDVEDPFRHRYTLEVTSPGLDRKLYSADDYQRFTGRRVTVRMRPSFREHRTVTGELLGLDDEVVRLQPDSGSEIQLPYHEIHETRLEVDWSSIMNEGKSRR